MYLLRILIVWIFFAWWVTLAIVGIYLVCGGLELIFKGKLTHWGKRDVNGLLSLWALEDGR